AVCVFVGVPPLRRRAPSPCTTLFRSDLLARAPSLDWLKPYVRGRSTWNLMLAVPRARAGASASADDTVAGELRLRSNLVGTRLRSEEHTSELQSRENLVCRLLLEKKK